MVVRRSGEPAFAVRADCQKITSRPRALANTNIDRASRPLSRIRSIAAPRRSHDRTATRSMISASIGHASAPWQYSLAVRGHTSRTFKTTPSRPNGRRTTNGNVDSGSGFRAITKSSTHNSCRSAREGRCKRQSGPGECKLSDGDALYSVLKNVDQFVARKQLLDRWPDQLQKGYGTRRGAGS